MDDPSFQELASRRPAVLTELIRRTTTSATPPLMSMRRMRSYSV
jgi:hypothetical protein